MVLEQLYYMYYNTKPKSVPKGVIVVCFHPSKLVCFNVDGINTFQGLKSGVIV